MPLMNSELQGISEEENLANSKFRISNGYYMLSIAYCVYCTHLQALGPRAVKYATRY